MTEQRKCLGCGGDSVSFEEFEAQAEEGTPDTAASSCKQCGNMVSLNHAPAYSVPWEAVYKQPPHVIFLLGVLTASNREQFRHNLVGQVFGPVIEAAIQQWQKAQAEEARKDETKPC